MTSWRSMAPGFKSLHHGGHPPGFAVADDFPDPPPWSSTSTVMVLADRVDPKIIIPQ